MMTIDTRMEMMPVLFGGRRGSMVGDRLIDFQGRITYEVRKSILIPTTSLRTLLPSDLGFIKLPLITLPASFILVPI